MLCVSYMLCHSLCIVCVLHVTSLLCVTCVSDTLRLLCVICVMTLLCGICVLYVESQRETGIIESWETCVP